ncbi:532_t:CDS:2, partial [Scutellospora calospora]
SNETSNNSDKQELEVNKMSIETTNIDKLLSLKLIEVEMTLDEIQPKAKAKATTKNVTKSIEGIKAIQEDNDQESSLKNISQ